MKIKVKAYKVSSSFCQYRQWRYDYGEIIFIKVCKMNIIIIGAGASGIACAVKAKQNNPCAGVTVLEQHGEI